MQLFSISEISQQIGLEESLLRFYESEHPEAFPKKILRGDHLLFQNEAVDIFLNIHRNRQNTAAALPSPQPQITKYSRVIAVTSGKGGVGKSNIALNLAIELQQLKVFTVVLDGDLGLANLHLLAGITPSKTLTDLVDDSCNLTEVLIQGPGGIGILPGGSGIRILADSNHHDRMKILQALQEIEQHADILLIDTGAGMGEGVRHLLQAADELLFVLTPEITSLADSYGLLKAACSGTPLTKPVYTVINQVLNIKQAAETANRFSACSKQFLGLDIINLGYILKDATVAAAIARQTPYCLFKPDAKVSRNTHAIARALLHAQNPEIRMHSAFTRYQNILESLHKEAK